MSLRKKNKKSLFVFESPPDFHLAVIMDGNGRWAKKKGWPRYFGHFRGVRALLKIVKSCSQLGIPYLTVFAFSTENWKRSSQEISVIMKLIQRSLSKYQKELNRYQVRLRVLGDLEELNPSVSKLFNRMVEQTKENQGLQLIVAVNYGGRREIIQAVRTVAHKVKAGEIKTEDIREKTFSKYLASSIFPPPDMIIRTGEVSRLSNFYLWSAIYSEIYVTPVLWPDFNEEELLKALEFYTKTSRRFGALPNEE